MFWGEHISNIQNEHTKEFENCIYNILQLFDKFNILSISNVVREDYSNFTVGLPVLTPIKQE